VDRALWAVVMEAYVSGVSTRLPGRRPACRRH
jgi:transposase-like protein